MAGDVGPGEVRAYAEGYQPGALVLFMSKLVEKSIPIFKVLMDGLVFATPFVMKMYRKMLRVRCENKHWNCSTYFALFKIFCNYLPLQIYEQLPLKIVEATIGLAYCFCGGPRSGQHAVRSAWHLTRYF